MVSKNNDHLFLCLRSTSEIIIFEMQIFYHSLPSKIHEQFLQICLFSLKIHNSSEVSENARIDNDSSNGQLQRQSSNDHYYLCICFKINIDCYLRNKCQHFNKPGTKSIS